MSDQKWHRGGYIRGDAVPVIPMPGERIIPLRNIRAVQQISAQLRAGEINQSEHDRRFEELTVPWG